MDFALPRNLVKILVEQQIHMLDLVFYAPRESHMKAQEWSMNQQAGQSFLEKKLVMRVLDSLQPNKPEDPYPPRRQSWIQLSSYATACWLQHLLLNMQQAKEATEKITKNSNFTK